MTEGNDGCLALLLFQELPAPSERLTKRPAAGAHSSFSSYENLAAPGASKSEIGGAVAPCLAERALDYLIGAMQPSPALAHAELLVVGCDGTCWHFATYLSDVAQYRPSDGFYMAHEWRAVPVATDAAVCVELLRQCTAAHAASTPYSLMRYPVATSLLGWTAPLLSEDVDSPAQCAALSARLLQHVLPVGSLPLPAPRYNPALLFRHALRVAASLEPEASRWVQSLPATDSNFFRRTSAKVALREGSLGDLKQLTAVECAQALREVAADVCTRVRTRVHGWDRSGADFDLRTSEQIASDLRDLAWCAIRCAELRDGTNMFGGGCNTNSVV